MLVLFWVVVVVGLFLFEGFFGGVLGGCLCVGFWGVLSQGGLGFVVFHVLLLVTCFVCLFYFCFVFVVVVFCVVLGVVLFCCFGLLCIIRFRNLIKFSFTNN